MPQRLVYSFDRGTKTIPAGFAFSRASTAFAWAGAQWVAVGANTPRWEDRGLRFEPGVVNLLTRSVPGSGSWTNEGLFKLTNRSAWLLGDDGAKGVEARGLGTSNEPVLRHADSGTTSLAITLSLILEAQDAERFVAGFYDGSTWVEWMRALYADGSVLNEGAAWTRRLTSLGAGPNGGKLYLLEIRMPRGGYDVGLAPVGEYATHLGAIVHHVQLEELPWATSPVLSAGSAGTRDQDRLEAAVDAVPLPLTLAVEAVTAPGLLEQTLWQIDAASDADRLRVVRDPDGAVLLERWEGDALADQITLLAATNDEQSFGLAIRIDTDRSVAWSVNGGLEQAGSLTGWGSYTQERWGCEADSSISWSGHVARAERWYDAATDLTTLSTDSLGLAGTAPQPVPASAWWEDAA